MQEADIRAIETGAIEVPEASGLPFGAPLDKEKIEVLRGYAIDKYSNYSTGIDSKEEFIEQLNATGEGYSSELGLQVLAAIGRAGDLKGIDNTPEQLRHAAQDEASFQAVLASSVLHGYQTVTRMPKLYEVVAGREAFDEEIDRVVEKNPDAVITNIARLSSVLGSEDLKSRVTAAYEAFSQDEKRSIRPFTLSPELVDIIGKERLAIDVHKAIASGDYFGAAVSFEDIEKTARLGLIDPGEALVISLGALRQDRGYVNLPALEKIVAMSSNPEQAWKSVQERVLAALKDSNVSDEYAGKIAQPFLSKWNSSYDQEFAAKVIQEVRDSRGVIALLPIVSSLGDDESEQKLANETLSEALRLFKEEADADEKGELAEALLPLSARFDSDTRRELIAVYADYDPSGFLMNSVSLRPHEENTEEYNEFLRSSALSAIDRLEPERFISSLHLLKEWFVPGDPRLHKRALAAAAKAERLDVSGLEELIELISKEEVASQFARVLDTATSSWERQSNFSSAIKVFGLEEAQRIFNEQIRSKPEIALGLLANNQMALGDERVLELIQTVVDSENMYQLVPQLKNLAYRLPEAEIVRLLDIAVEQAPRPLLEELNKLTKFIDVPTTDRLIHDVLRQNPALILSYLKRMPEGFIDGADEVIAFMKQDERTALAPKYFHKMMKQLPKVEETTAFIILSREAQRVYAKINKVLSLDEGRGKDMLVRIKDTIGSSSERAELDSISFAALMASEGVDPETIQTVDDAKKGAIAALNGRLGTSLDPARFAEIEEKVGNLVPISMYATLINDKAGRAYRQNGIYLKEIISQLDSGYFRMWRYGDREALMSEKVLPELSQSQYSTWQHSVSVETADVVADDAASVALKIQEVISRGLQDNDTIQKFSNLSDPTRTIGDLQAEVGTAGVRISEVHKMKKAGELSEEDAASKVMELQAEMQELELAVSVVRLSKVTPEEVAAGFLFNENGRPTKATIDGALNQIVERYGTEAMEAFGQLEAVLENFREAATTDIGNITVSDVDDFQTTFEIGANPVGSCQHYELGQLNAGLPGYFEPNVKIITVRNAKDRLVARAIVRLAADEGNQPVMVMEPVYMSQASTDIESAIQAHAKAKADSMGIQLYREEKGGRKDIHLPHQRAPAIYSDLFGGIRLWNADEYATPRIGLVPVR